MKFTLGQSVVISRREYTYDPFLPWREGTITAVGDKAVRVRTMTPYPWGKVRWIHLDDPCCQVTITEE